jgi:hypothetical protein
MSAGLRKYPLKILFIKLDEIVAYCKETGVSGQSLLCNLALLLLLLLLLLLHPLMILPIWGR